MRVYDQNLNGAGAAQTGGTQDIQRTDRGGGSHSRGVAGDGDRVELSGAIGALSRVLGADQAGRAARIQELAAQYERGEYRADADATARAMTSEALLAAAR